MKEELHLFVQEQDTGTRIDKFISVSLEHMTRSAVQKLLEQGNVLINHRVVNKNFRVLAGQTVDLFIPEAVPLDIISEKIPLKVLYEDQELLVVNKPKGMVVHPAVGNFSGTLVNALMAHCGSSLSGINGVIRPGIVHRIDKDTSGLLIVAKNDLSHQVLAEQIKAHTFTREYEAIVYGNVKNDVGTIDVPIGRHPVERKKMAVTNKNSRNAVTHYNVIERYQGFTHLRLKLETGRTHQIRVHMAYAGHPVAGDPVYGPKKVIASLQGQCLHAKTIGFRHPADGRYLEFSSELPDYFKLFLNTLKRL